MDKLILPAIHLAIVVGFIVYMVKTPFGNFIRTRHKEVFEGLNKSKIQALEAEAKKKEVEAKLSSLELEKQKIVAESKEREVAQIKAIQESSQRIIAQMKTEAEQNKQALEASFKAEALKSVATQVLIQAEAKIRQGLNSDSHRKINERFTAEVSSTQSSSKALEA
jgi:F0F1-type ATP synthase membrane subunit b/b'